MCTQRDKNVLNRILNPNLPFDFESENSTSQTKENYSHLPKYLECEFQNMEGIKLAENGDFDNALTKFNKSIEMCPENPSPYNNRAQLYRLMSKIPEAQIDLDKSLSLSNGQGLAAAQSFVQKALIYRLQNEAALAKENFEKAANLGSNFAKSQLIAMNPYAAMCNKMLGEIMTKFKATD